MGNQSTGIQSSGSRLSNRNQLNNSKFNSQENNQGNESSRQRRITVSKHNFELMYVIGRGGFGKVWKVIFKKDKLIYAMKEMAKTKIIDKKSESSVKYERDLLSKITHPFIVNMHYAFQDYDNLFIVMDFLTGGDMRYHISRHKRFTEEQTSKFCFIIQ